MIPFTIVMDFVSVRFPNDTSIVIGITFLCIVYLLPDGVETLTAAEDLCREGFTDLPYVNADPVLCKRLEETGCATVMPLGSWIGSNQGLRTKAALEIIIEQAGKTVHDFPEYRSAA